MTPPAPRRRLAAPILPLLAAFLLVAAILGGCREDPRARDSALYSAVVRGLAQGVALDALTAELADIRRSLSEGDGADVDLLPFACDAADLLAADLRERDGLVRSRTALAELERLCGREVPLTLLTRALGRIEARRVAQAPTRGPSPPASVTRAADAADCASAARAAAPLREHFAEAPAVTPLLTLHDRLCPALSAP